MGYPTELSQLIHEILSTGLMTEQQEDSLLSLIQKGKATSEDVKWINQLADAVCNGRVELPHS